MTGTNIEQIDTVGQLDAFIERVATPDAAGTHTVIVKVPGVAADVDSVVDRIRQLPQSNGWRNLSVLVGETTGEHASLTVTNTDTVGTPADTESSSKPAKGAAAKTSSKSTSGKGSK